MRVFVDTNVLVAALATRGLCADLLRVVLSEHELVVSDAVMTGLERVLTLKLGVPDTTIGEIVSMLAEYEVVHTPAADLALELRDPDDVPILAAAVAAEVDVLLTGDRDLLAVADFVPIPIMRPRELWQRFRADEEC